MSSVKVYPLGEKKEIYLELPNKCPICQHKIAPLVVNCVRNIQLYDSDSILGFSVVLGCPACNQLFIGYVYDEFPPYEVTDLEPQKPDVRQFDEPLSQISPTFIEIYHQAQAAEAYGLTQITGMGYRKALEFLVKDYAKHKNPGEEETIEEMLLAKCIDIYINHPQIKATAKAAVWLGNDETHYIRKWEDKDITDMKHFIDACVFFILADYRAEEARKMIESTK